MPPRNKERQEWLVNFGADQLARLIFMSWLEQKGIDPWKYPLPSLDLELPEAQPPVSEDTDDLQAA